MLRCIELGQKALGSAAPNPMVGCVIVCDNKIIGEGFTDPYGGPHAEVNAINSVHDKELLLRATLYVSLEPCAHHGKTPPCANLLVQLKIPEVVIGIRDPNPKVSGKGIKLLQDAACKVSVGIMKEACHNHHKRFLSVHELHRPYIILKWAQSLDGYMAPEKSKRSKEIRPFWISNVQSRLLVHQWRSEEQAILVGAKTVLEDNPVLNTRMWKGKSPIRIVLDKELEIDTSYQILNDASKTIQITSIKNRVGDDIPTHMEFIDFKKDIPAQICKVLMEYQINSCIIEGGFQTLQTFLAAGLWDEARIFTGQEELGAGLKAPKINGHLIDSMEVKGDTLEIFQHD